MKITQTFKLEYDKDKESLVKFREKYMRFRAYIEGLQIKGVLPVDEINWMIARKQPAIIVTDGEGQQYLPLPNEGGRLVIMPIHKAGDRAGELRPQYD